MKVKTPESKLQDDSFGKYYTTIKCLPFLRDSPILLRGCLVSVPLRVRLETESEKRDFN